MIKLAVLSGLLLLLCVSCGSALEVGPWKGKIIDVETREPIEGAVVLAVWERVYRTPFGPNSYFYEAKEVVTDKAGEFEIPSYTPINLLPIISYMRGPLFTIFKPSYGSLNRISIGGYFTGEAQEEQDFNVEEKRYRYSRGVIELPRLKTRDERKRNLYSLPPSIPDKEMRRLIQTMNKEEIELGLQPSHISGGSK